MKVKLHTIQRVGPGEERMAVPGGWIYRIYSNGIACTFVPDPNLEIEK